MQPPIEAVWSREQDAMTHRFPFTMCRILKFGSVKIRLLERPYLSYFYNSPLYFTLFVAYTMIPLELQVIIVSAC